MKSLLGSRHNRCFRECVEKNPEGSFLILRHDVDFSPEAACRMAQLEANLDIKATYFILLSPPYYNLLSEKYVDFPRRLIEMGHEIGLHYDVHAMEKACRGGALIDVLRREIDVLSPTLREWKSHRLPCTTHPYQASIRFGKQYTQMHMPMPTRRILPIFRIAAGPGETSLSSGLNKISFLRNCSF